MKFRKILISLSVCLALVLAVLPATASATTAGNYTYTVLRGKATITRCNTSISGNVTVPSTLGGYPVTAIAEEAFQFCDEITSLTIPEGVTSIGYAAFEYCDAMTSISLPNTLTHVGFSAFYGCDSLTYHSYSNAMYLGNTGNPYLVLMWAKSISITQCTIHAKTRIVNHYAFEDCYRLTSITIPQNVTMIGGFAFSGCSKLKTVTLRAGVNAIHEYVFEDCIALTSITIPEGTTYLGHCTFQGCTALKTVKLPSTMISVESSVFSECEKLNYNAYGNALYLGNANNQYAVLIQAQDPSITQCQIHPSTKVIADEAFVDCKSLTSLFIPDGVITIGDSAFDGCRSLASIRIPDSAINIWSTAFYGCLSLTPQEYDNCLYLGNENNPYHVLFDVKDSYITSCEIHPGTKTLATFALSYCSSLETVTIPASVSTICAWAFNNCYSLEDVYYGSTPSKWKKVRVDDDNEYLLQATFHFAEAQSGDLDGDGDLTTDDAVYLLLHVLFGEEDYPVQSGNNLDYSGDATVDTDDAVYLLLHVLFGEEDYPI